MRCWMASLFVVALPLKWKSSLLRMERLSAELHSAGFDGSAARLSFLVEWLFCNDVKVTSDLAGVSRVDLDNAEDLVEDELVFLENIGADRLRKATNAPCRLSSRSPKRRGYLQGERREYKLGGAFGKVIEQKLKVTDTVDVTGSGPLAMVNLVGTQLISAVSRAEWLENARSCALAGSCSKSHPSVRSGIRCYQRFAERVLGHDGDELPPNIDELLAWSTLFRCSKTFSNYLNYVRLGCELVHVATGVFDSPMLKRAKRSIDKKRKFVARGQFFLRLTDINDLLTLSNGISLWLPLAMLFLTSYVFLLRVPSEGLPITVGGNGVCAGQAVIYLEGDELVLQLKSRKNRPQGSTLRRGCWCRQCKATCPVHVLGAWVKTLRLGQRAFAGISAASALADLRRWLHMLEVPEAEKYRLHDFRRGHARDLQASGKNLAFILAAGEWKSPAFLCYLDKVELENEAVAEVAGSHLDAHFAESSEEDVDPV